MTHFPPGLFSSAQELIKKTETYSLIISVSGLDFFLFVILPRSTTSGFEKTKKKMLLVTNGKVLSLKH